MKVKSFDVRAVSLPGRAGTPAAEMSNFVTLKLRTEDDVVGIGYAGFVPRPMLKALRAAVRALAELTVGDDPMLVEGVTKKLLAAGGMGAPAGLTTRAVAAIDIALWDLRGRILGQPVYRLLGGARDRVPCYASGELWRGDDLNALADAAGKLAEQGFRAVKLRMGDEQTIPAEIERLRVVREAVGPEVAVMVDINQGWDVNRSIAVGRRAERYDLYWLEDPINHEDFDGLARIAAALDTPVTAGEYIYGMTSFRAMLEKRAVDVAMIDLLRAGGLTGWMKIAHLSEAFNLPVATHLAPEILLHAACAAPNVAWVEHMPWAYGLFREVPEIENGEMIVRKRPGLGLEFDEEALDKFAA